MLSAFAMSVFVICFRARSASILSLMSLTFDKKGDGTGYYTYTTKFKNDTGLEFDDLWFNIDLIDKDGTVVEQECISFDEVADGKSYSGDFFTDAKFDRYEITAEYTLKSE